MSEAPQLDVVFAYSVDFACLVDARMNLVRISANWLSTFGWDEAELVGRPFIERIHPDDRGVTRARIQAALRGDHQDVFSNRFLIKDGGRLWLEWRAQRLSSGEILAFGRDVSHRVALEHELRESEQRFRDFSESMSDWMWETDADHRFTYVSENVAETTGFPQSFFLGKRREELTNIEPSTPEWRAHLEDLAHQRPFRNFVYSRSTPTGGVQYLSINGKPNFDAQGRFLGYRGASTDVTPQTRAMAALQASEQRFRDFTEALTDWVWETDADHRFTYVSEKAAASTGYPVSHFIGKRRHEAGAIDNDPEAWRAHIDDIENHRPFRNFVYSRTRPSGGVRWFSVNGKPRFDEEGRFLGYRGASTDVTEHMEALAEVKNNEQRFRDFADSVTDWFWETDAEHRFVYMSPSVATRTGITAGFHLGRSRRSLADTADVKLDPQKWLRHEADLAAHRPFRDFRYWRRGPDGQIAHLSASGVPVFDIDGKFVGYRGGGRDVTAEVRAIDRLRASEEKARTANEAKTVFLAKMSHELRTPLNAIIGFSEILRDEQLGPGVAERYRSYAADIHHSGDLLLSLISDILDVSRIEAGKFTLNMQKVDLNEILPPLARLAEFAPGGPGRRFELELEDALPSVVADARAVRQMAANLVTNALKYSREGGQIRLIASRVGPELHITVEDAGPGIPKASLAEALTPFSQPHDVNTAGGSGVGLGLTIVNSLIEMHGGRLFFSHLDDGFAATLAFPASRLVERNAA